MMSMMVAARVHGVHITWQYTKLDVIRQALENDVGRIANPTYDLASLW